MSIKYMNRVWEIEELKGGRLLLMLALADHANDAGECWPSQSHLAKKARLTDRQVRRVIDSLVEDGYLAVLDSGVGRRKRPHYRLFLTPQKADILSGVNSDKMSGKKADISDTKADILSQEKRTFPTVKADISDANYSHARSEPPIEPPTESPIESSSSEDDDEPVRDAIHQTWFDTYGAEMPKNIEGLIASDLGQCDEAAILHAIRASINAKERTFRYLKSCALAYIPPAPEQATRPTYAVDLPGVYAMPVPDAPPSPKSLPPPMAHSDPWAVCLSELQGSLPGVALGYLAGSRLEAAGAVDGVPLYRVVCDERAAVSLGWLTVQAGPAIRRKLGSVLGKPVLIELVAMEAEQAADVTVGA